MTTEEKKEYYARRRAWLESAVAELQKEFDTIATEMYPGTDVNNLAPEQNTAVNVELLRRQKNLRGNTQVG